MLLAGDRLTCCDEAVVVVENQQIVSVATIAPKGEEMSGIPTIVAVYTPREFRHQGYGGAVLVAAIKRCKDRRFKKVRIDVISQYIMRILNSLSPSDQAYLDIVVYGNVMDLMP